MRILYVDSHDSFAWNLVQALRGLGATVDVVQADDRPDVLSRLDTIDRLVLGPGPGHPSDGPLVEMVRAVAGRCPLLGVCLGHQAIGLAFGADVRRHSVVHGHATPVHHDSSGLFAGMPQPVSMTRYHSLVVDNLRPPLRPTAWSEDGAIMALAHCDLPIWGVQFHPESVLSGAPGVSLLANFASGWKQDRAVLRALEAQPI